MKHPCIYTGLAYLIGVFWGIVVTVNQLPTLGTVLGIVIVSAILGYVAVKLSK